jgi:antitoxin component YwqK of YwqJK toxin-antitoxin module
MKLYLLSALVFCCLITNAQTNAPINSAEIFKSAVAFRDEKKYAEALAEMNKIDRNDTSYADALLQKTILYKRLEQYDNSIKACQEGILLNNDDLSSYHINLGNAYLGAKKHTEAIAAYDEGLRKFPFNPSLTYNKAIVYEAMKKYPEAVEMYKQTIKLSPFHTNSHLNLGLLALEEGKVAQAMLSLDMYLMLEPNGDNSLGILQKLLEIVTSKYEKEPKNINLSPEGGDDFSDLDLIINNYAALDKNFKIPVNLKLAITKQNYALFTKMEYDKNDKGFWMQTYVNFYKELMKNNLFEGFSFYSIQASTNETYVKLVKKNMPKINKFVEWAGANIDKIHADREIMLNGKKQMAHIFFNGKGRTISEITLKNPAGLSVGDCQFFYPAGNLQTTGFHDENSKRSGTWLFYNPQGDLVDKEIYKNGLLEGEQKAYYTNGKLSWLNNFENGKKTGPEKRYNKAGLLTGQYEYKDGLLNGKFTSYYDLGEEYKHFDGEYIQDKINHTLTEYFDNGVPSEVSSVVSHELDGAKKTFHRNSKPASEEFYVKGQKDGKFKFFYSNGQIHKLQQWKAGVDVGEWKSYYPDGTQKDEFQLDEKGKKNGVYKNYDTDGKITFEETYAKGDNVSYKYYDKQGKVIKEAVRKKGELDYAGYYPDGVLKATGIFTAEGKKGLWKYYDEYGNLKSEEMQDAHGKLDGPLKKYYPNGKVKEEQTYKQDLQEGHYISYFSNGTIEKEGWLADGKMQGYWLENYPDGTKKEYNYYINGQQTGFQQNFGVKGKLESEEFFADKLREKVTYFDSLGTPLETVISKNQTGNFVRHFNNKKEMMNGKYVLGTAHGPFTWYTYAGKVSTKGTFHNGTRHGLWQWYYDNGQLKTEGNYSYGDLDGKWTYYHPNGKIEKTLQYADGNTNGEAIYYFDNGQVDNRFTNKNGEKEGDAFLYSSNGDLQLVKTYHNGKAISYSYNDPTGKLIPAIPIKSKDYKVVSYYKNGNKSREYEIKNGEIQGKYIRYFADGKVEKLENYKDDNLYGTSYVYYPNGKVKTETNHLYDLNHGSSKTYFPEGNLESEVLYVLDAKHGVAKYYNKLNKLIRKETYNSDVMVKTESF